MDTTEAAEFTEGRISVCSDDGDEDVATVQTLEQVAVNGKEAATEDSAKRARVDWLITEAKNRGHVSLDLSQCGIFDLPDELLKLTHLEYLYLEGNCLTRLPDDFFGCFSNLRWLDLRHNRLTDIPSSYLKDMAHLQTLLLEGNNLSSLPLELGFVQVLDGLNIRNNPLLFPPSEVIEKGVKTIIAFLQTMYNAKSAGDGPQDLKLLMNEISHSNQKIDATDAHDGEISATNSAAIQKARKSAGRVCRKENRTRKKSSKQILKTQSEKYLDPEAEQPITEDKVASKYLEEKALARLKELKIKQDEIIQALKNQDMVKNWRDEAKSLQQKKNMEKRIKGKIDFDEPVTKAPFGISNSDLKILTNEERLASDPNAKPVANKPMEPEEVMRLEEAKRQQEHLLVAKIKEHTKAMLERRLHPLENPQMEMEAALHDFEIAEKLQQEIEIRRKELEYGFSSKAADVTKLKSLTDEKKY